VRIDLRSKRPTVTFTRQPADDGATYLGPFYSGYSLKQSLRLLRRIFPYYTSKTTSKLNRQIGLEPNGMNLTEYRRNLRQLISYIKGNRVEVMQEIEREMKKSAEKEDFEKAAHYRNQLQHLQELKKQIVIGREEFLDLSKDQGLVELQKLFNLPQIPRRIEVYDISHLSGKFNTASMVVFTNGLADKSQYRKFKLRLKGNNDTAQLREVIERRLKHLSDWGRPEVILLDGGKPQISAVKDLLQGENIAFLARNKSGDHSRNAEGQIILPDGKIAEIAPDGHLQKLLTRVDEEAHRFAVNYHTYLRQKKLV